MNPPFLSIRPYGDSPESFDKKLNKKFQNEIAEFYAQPEYPDKSEIFHLLKNNFTSRYPPIHKYNNIIGFAELLFDEGDVLIYFYLNGDRRKRYNKNNSLRIKRTSIYSPISHLNGGHFVRIDNFDIRNAFTNAFLKVERQCKDWKIFVDLAAERQLISYFDFEGYFKTHSDGQ